MRRCLYFCCVEACNLNHPPAFALIRKTSTGLRSKLQGRPDLIGAVEKKSFRFDGKSIPYAQINPSLKLKGVT